MKGENIKMMTRIVWAVFAIIMFMFAYTNFTAVKPNYFLVMWGLSIGLLDVWLFIQTFYKNKSERH